MPANVRLRHAVAAPAILVGLLVGMTLATPARADVSEPPSYRVAKTVVLKAKPPKYVLPVEGGYRLTGRFGDVSGYWASVHTGLDFAAAYGTPIHAIAGGTVTFVGYDGSYGTKTVIRMANGTDLWFAHQSSTAVTVGQTVVPGQVIGYIGMTGNTTGPHVHVEVRPGGGDPVDPYAALIRWGLHP